jgi:dethiobiotin synthetase
MLTRIGVTGTDTGVGKTVVATALITTLRHSGVQVAPMKPVETGGGDDAVRLSIAAGDMYPLDLVRPISFAEPLAPLVAARRAHAPIDVAVLNAAFSQLRSMSDTIVVEGAGGLLVPVTDTETFATLFKRWELELIVVAANRLGAVNHTLLTVECARVHGLTVRGVVLNTISNGQSDVAERTNEALLKELLRSIPVVSVPYISTPHGDRKMAELLAELFRDLLPSTIAPPA